MSYRQYNNNNSGNYYQRNSGYNNNNYQQRNNNGNTRSNTGYRHGYAYQDSSKNNYNRQEGSNVSLRDGQSRQMNPNSTYSHNDNNPSDVSHQLYMGELDFSWTEEDIKQIWQGLGERNVKVKLMKNGNNRFNDDTNKNNSGYCFIEFNTHEQASNALMKNGMSIPNHPQRRLKLNWGNSGSRHHGADNSTKYSIFVGDLAPNVTDSQLYELFNNKYPLNIESVKVMVDRMTGVSKGYGFVNFSNIESQKRSMAELQGTYLNGRAIKIGSTGQSASSSSSQQRGTIDNERSVTRKEGSSIHSNKNRFSLFMLPVQQIPKLNHMTDPNNSTLYVTKISPYISLEEIQEYFNPFGTIILFESVNTMKGNNNNSNKMYQQAIIQYINRYDAEKAMISLQQYPINDIPLQISWGLPISREYNKDSDIIKLSLPTTPQPAYPKTIYSSYT